MVFQVKSLFIKNIRNDIVNQGGTFDNNIDSNNNNNDKYNEYDNKNIRYMFMFITMEW